MRMKKPGRTRLDVTVVRLDGKRVARCLHTPPGQFLSERGVNALLLQEAERVEQFFPGVEFRLVPLRGGKFNFVEIRSDVTPEAERVGEMQCSS
jgi:hypothetical protein